MTDKRDMSGISETMFVSTHYKARIPRAKLEIKKIHTNAKPPTLTGCDIHIKPTSSNYQLLLI